MPSLTPDQLAAYDLNNQLINKLNRMCTLSPNTQEYFKQLHTLFKEKKEGSLTVENVARILGCMWKSAEGCFGGIVIIESVKELANKMGIYEETKEEKYHPTSKSYVSNSLFSSLDKEKNEEKSSTSKEMTTVYTKEVIANVFNFPSDKIIKLDYEILTLKIYFTEHALASEFYENLKKNKVDCLFMKESKDRFLPTPVHVWIFNSSLSNFNKYIEDKKSEMKSVVLQ